MMPCLGFVTKISVDDRDVVAIAAQCNTHEFSHIALLILYLSHWGVSTRWCAGLNCIPGIAHNRTTLMKPK